MRADVLIIGGGPAGASAALALRRYSELEVVVLERGDYHEPRVGETIGPGVRPLLNYLGVEGAFQAAGHRRAYSSSAAWGDDQVFTHDFLHTGQGDGWHLDRNRFDRSLAEAAREAGATVLTATRAAGVRRVGDSWRVQAVSRHGTPSEIEARFVIDAGGRSAAVARELGGQIQTTDRLAGVIGFVDFPSPWSEPNVVFVESVPEGWWYSAPLPEDRLAVAFMSDADLIQDLGASRLDGWLRVLAQAPQTRARVVGGRRPLQLLTRQAASQVLSPAGGDGWLACGDAAAARDPLSSTGIGHALASGAHAARVAEAALRGDLELQDDYLAAVVEQYHLYLQTCRRIYNRERRWPREPFWARRTGPDAEVAHLEGSAVA